MYRPELISEAVQAVWESAPNDDALQAMTPTQMWEYLKGWEFDREEENFIWYELSDRIDRVFRQGAY
jgi:hypothetical protein